MLIPTHDEESALVARNHELLAQRYRLTTPPWDVLRAAYDKRCTHALGEAASARAAVDGFPAGSADLDRAEGHFPVVIKPAYKQAANRLTIDKAWRADDPATLQRRYAEACALVDPAILMVQELVPGDGDAQLSYAALCADGQVLASLTARRLRQFPMDFGRASTYVETVDEPSVERDARRLLKTMSYTGIVEVEFKRDPRTGANLLLDVNPRAWGWQSLCGRAGVDFPYLLWLMAGGGTVPSARGTPGVRWVRMTTDLLAVAGELRAGRLSARAYMRSLRRPLEFAVYARDDPRPALVGPWRTARLIAGRMLEGRPGVSTVESLTEPRWTRLIERAPAATIFHHPAWIAHLRRTYGYPISATCVADSDSELVAGLPVATVTSRLTGRRLVALPFSDLCPPLVAAHAPQWAGPALGEELQALQRRLRVPLEIRGSGAGLGDAAPAERFHHHVLALEPDVAAVQRRFARSHVLRGVRRARREGLSTVVRTDRTALECFYRLHVGTRRRLGVPTQPRRFILGLDTLFAEGLGFVLVVHRERRPIRGGGVPRSATPCSTSTAPPTAASWERARTIFSSWRRSSGGAPAACAGWTLAAPIGGRRACGRSSSRGVPTSASCATPAGRRGASGAWRRRRASRRRRDPPQPPLVGRVIGEVLYRHAG